MARGESIFSMLGRRRCSRLSEVLADSAPAGAERDLTEIVREITDRELSARVVGRHPDRISLTDMFDEGATFAKPVIAQAGATDTVLEYGGGIGHVAESVAPHVERLVSVDRDPRAAAYGSALVQGVEFHPLDDLAAGELFDGAYSIAAFERLQPAEWEAALGYLHRHLAPGGWLVVVHPARGPEFRALYEPLFRGLPSPVRDGSLVLEKRASQARPAPVASGDRWAVDETSVVADVLHDEVVVVDLDSGAYYILEGSASVIWQMLAAGQDVPSIVATLSEWHPEHAGGMDSAVGDFAAQLAGEGLLVPTTDDDGAAVGFDASELRTEAFKPPEMFRYTEMEALIQMDPIREYDETGWPRRPAARTRRM